MAGFNPSLIPPKPVPPSGSTAKKMFSSFRATPSVAECWSSPSPFRSISTSARNSSPCAQWRTGVRYHRIWRQGCLTGYVQFQYREGDGGERKTQFVPPGAFALEWRNAQLSIRGVPERRVAYSVCCDEHFLNTCPEFPSLRTARRKGMPLLLTALEDLVAYFVIVDEEKRNNEKPY